MYGCSDEAVPSSDGTSSEGGSSDESDFDEPEVDAASTSTSTSASVSTGSPDEDSVCGNGVREGTEECDGEDLDSHSCDNFTWGAVEAWGSLGCTDDCRFDTNECLFCGDGVVQGDEICDWGEDTPPTTCEALGHGPGTLGCGYSCRIFDVTSCCGDGSKGEFEQCEGEDLGGETCESLDFSGGELGCNDGCGFDTSACTLCGNGIVEAGEECEVGELLGLSCTDFVPEATSGELSCDPNSCEFVASDCSYCGDGVLQAHEACDPGIAADLLCADLAPGATEGVASCDPVTCEFDLGGCEFCGDGIVQPGEECDPAAVSNPTCGEWAAAGGDPPCGPACTYSVANCVPPSAGLVVITEIETNGVDWFELHNPDPSTPWPLGGCVVEGFFAFESFTIDTAVVVPAGDSIVIAGSDDAAAVGVAPDFVPAEGVSLVSSGDVLRLVCGGVLIDEVVFDDDPPWPEGIGEGLTLSLDAAQTDAVANDAGGAWCAVTPTPGAANAACP